ncbi:MAG TPA: hypothetical protein VEB41_14950 [Burkholderiales bacterium]|nr:hypothetical protein [Burkholderiales bacterium]
MRSFLIACIAAASLAGCSSARVQVNSATGGVPASPAAGTSVSAGGGGLHVRSSGAVATAIVVISLIAAGIEYNREERPFPDPRALLPGNSEPAAPLAADRPTNEQDCSKPVADPYANLKCR